MNKLEQAWYNQLRYDWPHLRDPVVLYERFTLKLADDTRYTPDFFVLDFDGNIEFHETKGYFRDDALVKLKVAATQFPWFTFKLVTRKGGAWQVKEILPAD